MSDVTVRQVDELFVELAKKEAEKEAIAATLTAKNKEITTLEIRVTELLDSLERDSYESPFGKASIKEEMQVKNPTDDKKHLLWDWMKERGVFERYAQVHATSLKTLFKSERLLAIENGEDPITFTLPGMEPATYFRKLTFKAKKQEK